MNTAILKDTDSTAGSVTSTVRKLFKRLLNPARFKMKNTSVRAITSPIPSATVKMKANLTADQKLTLTSFKFTGLAPDDSLRLT
jgi:hypothetical protein